MVADQLSDLTAAQAERDTKPVRDLAHRLRQALDKYERSAVVRAQRRLTRKMLMAIGNTGELTSVVPEEHEAPEAVALLGELSALSSMLTPPVSLDVQSERAPETLPSPPASAPAPSAAAASAPPSREREPTDHEVKQIADLVAEVTALEEDWPQQPKERVYSALCAIAAEMRQLLNIFPHGHKARWDLEALPSRLHVLCRDSGVSGFVNGISTNATGDWTALSRKHRRALATLGQRAQRKQDKPSAPKWATLGDAIGRQLRPSQGVDVARWPSLRAVLGARKLILVGNVSKPEKARSVQERTGLPLEWEVLANNPRQVDSLVQRIGGGGVGACLLAEGLMSHKDYYRIEAACKSGHVPYAFCDKAGVGAIDQALDVLETKCKSGV